MSADTDLDTPAGDELAPPCSLDGHAADVGPYAAILVDGDGRPADVLVRRDPDGSLSGSLEADFMPLAEAGDNSPDAVARRIADAMEDAVLGPWFGRGRPEGT